MRDGAEMAHCLVGRCRGPPCSKGSRQNELGWNIPWQQHSEVEGHGTALTVRHAEGHGCVHGGDCVQGAARMAARD